MLRVLIADDENRICQLIAMLADWERLGMEVVGTAGDGEDALRQVHALRPDILITDIRMPGRDGLSVIREAKAFLPTLEVIIISGYAQFDYARTAIQYGVGEYLLKPINREDLNAALARMAETLWARIESDEAVRRLKRSAEDASGRRRQTLLHDLFADTLAQEPDAPWAARYGFATGDGLYQVFLLKMDYDTSRFSAESLKIMHGKSMDTFSQLLATRCDDLLIDCRGAAMVGVVCYPSGRQAQVRGLLRDGLNQMVARQGLFGEVLFSLALGTPVKRPQALDESMRNARAILAERLSEGTGRLLEGPAPLPALDEAALLSRYVQSVTRAVDVLDAEAAAAASEALRHAAAQRQAGGAELLNLVRGAGMLFIARLGAEDREAVLSRFTLCLDQCATVPALFACLDDLQRTQLVRMLANKRSQDGQPIRMAKQYIQQHFAEPLTLERVSAAIGFSVNYFSTLFKKETGEGFARYVTGVRMEEAKTLLRDTRLPVAQVCHSVGYEDTKHFTRLFRAETGLTPGEFRKLYG